MPETGHRKKGLRFIIYGTGAIGGAIGGHLALSGKDVILIGRPGQVNAIRENGLRLVTPSGTHTLRTTAVTTPGQISFQENDVVLLTVKGQNSEEALRDLQAAVKDIPVLCCQNGVRNEEIARKYFKRVYSVMVFVAGVYLTDGEIIVRRADPPGNLIIGSYPDGKDEFVDAVAAELRDAGFLVLASPEVMDYKWGKLVLNVSNAGIAITGGSDAECQRITDAARAEATELLAEAGIHWLTRDEMAEKWPEINTKARGTLTGELRTSSWQSLARRQGSVESDFLNGEIVRVAEKLGKKAPVNETLVNISQEMAAKYELPGKYSVPELERRLGLG
ncbi:MAG: 2-dehydropantoate 2-reductase [Chloroflexota bacterium]